MARIERIGDATLYLGDCLEILPTLGDIDAIVTDPPYGINRGVSGHDVFKRFDQIVGDERPFDPRPVLKMRPAHHYIFWGANHYCERLPESGGRWLMWLKHDPAMFNSRSTAPFELAWTNLTGSDRAIKIIWDGSIKQGEGAGRKHLHPTEKPVELMTWCLDKVPYSGDGILDPFMGSGTTGVACAKLGRKFIGIEIEPKYFDIACRRIEAAYKQPDMFIEKPKPAEQLKLPDDEAA